MAFYEGVEGGLTEGIVVDPAEGFFAVNLFGFELIGVSVEIFDLLHGFIERPGREVVKGRGRRMKNGWGERRICCR